MTEATNPYALAGVDTEAGDLAVELMKAAVTKTHGPNVLGGLGGFGGLFDAGFLKAYDHPVLVTSTDGVGTKVAIAQAIDKHDTIGQDLVGMVVDDIIVTGARSLFMTDYIACGRLVPNRIADIVRGIAEACEQVGVALVGGETAEHPGLLGADEYDVAGAAVGAVEKSRILSAEHVAPGDVVLGMASSGLHSNGFSLVRKIIADRGLSYTDQVGEFAGVSLGEELLEPTRLYTGVLNDLLADSQLGSQVIAMSHITGGGIAANLSRVLPVGVALEVNRASWSPNDVFRVLADWGGHRLEDLEATLNLGLGFALIVRAEAADATSARLTQLGIPTWTLGEITAAPTDAASLAEFVTEAKGTRGGAVRLTGSYR
jgi:phosphoribosylformylglycinamidine cyclo-ligase